VGTLSVDGSCVWCKTSKVISVGEADFAAWMSGKPVQKTMPYLSAEDRELLVSGTCSKCFDEFADPEAS
jgi:hypothetical protein